jgi:hypothetical protein
MSTFESGNLTIVRDLLLDAPAFAMNAGPLLQSIFPDLISGDGVLLKRLLTRFLAFATVPNEQMKTIACAAGMDANEARAAFRRPNWPYWLDVLAVLCAHSREVVSTAPCETARIVEMWLEIVPPESIQRREVAEIAIMLGQRALDTRDDWFGRDEHGDRQRFYKCALLAAPEQPDEVSHIARVAAERIHRPAEVLEDFTAEPPSHSIFGPSVMRGPWPDGPLTHVDKDFQQVVLESTSIQHLFRVRPQEAREVVLAILVTPPHEVNWGSSQMGERELELVHLNWHTSLFTKGPFLLCIQVNFEEGLELIMRLVEFATERSNEGMIRKFNEWRECAVADGRSEAEIEEAVKSAPAQHLVLNDGTQEISFTGDAGSYCWSAGLTSREGYSPLPPPAVETALMALEQYFYQRLDAGQDIAEEIATTFARSRCVAPLGVLADVAKRETVLFEGTLRALLSAPELYAWEITKTCKGRSHLMMGAFMKEQGFIKIAQQFHGLEHRKRDLRDVAMELLLKSKEMKNFFSSVRDWWKKRQVAGEQLIDMSNQLDLTLDPANYEVHESSMHGHVIVNVALERLHAERANEYQEVNDRLLVTGFPIRCRMILDERRALTYEQLNELWQTWTRLRELAKNGSALSGGADTYGDEYVNAVMGGIAVFLWQDEWLAQDAPRRSEVERAIESILSGELPNLDEYHSEHDVSTFTWDCFLAESAAMLWVRAPQDARWRRLVGQVVFLEKYATVRILFARCSIHRVALGDDFGRLRLLVLNWAHVRDRAAVLRSMQHMGIAVDKQKQERMQGDMASWIEQSIMAFVNGSLPDLAKDWSRFDDAYRFAEVDALRRSWPDYRKMDFHLVRCSHEWMPRPDEAKSVAERASVIQFWRVALDVVVARPRADLQRRDHQYPNEDDVWVLENVAAAVLQLRANENPAQFWTAIIDLHSEVNDWSEEFLTAMHRHALSAEEIPATYAPLLREIAQHAFSEVDGQRRWPWHEEVWDSLIGIDYWVSDLWIDRHAVHVLRIWDVISLWMKNVPQDRRRLGKFARWLSKAAAKHIRLRVLPWFLAQLQPWTEQAFYRDDDTEDGLAKLLNVVWDQDQDPLRASSEQFSAFCGLLAWLVQQQNSIGLELQGRIGGLG